MHHQSHSEHSTLFHLSFDFFSFLAVVLLEEQITFEHFLNGSAVKYTSCFLVGNRSMFVVIFWGRFTDLCKIALSFMFRNIYSLPPGHNRIILKKLERFGKYSEGEILHT